MVECNVLKFGSFTLKSGRKSPFFMNAGAYTTGNQLARLGEFYAKAIHDNFGDNFLQWPTNDILFVVIHVQAVHTQTIDCSVYDDTRKKSDPIIKANSVSSE